MLPKTFIRFSLTRASAARRSSSTSGATGEQPNVIVQIKALPFILHILMNSCKSKQSNQMFLSFFCNESLHSRPINIRAPESNVVYCRKMRYLPLYSTTKWALVTRNELLIILKTNSLFFSLHVVALHASSARGRLVNSDSTGKVVNGAKGGTCS